MKHDAFRFRPTPHLSNDRQIFLLLGSECQMCSAVWICFPHLLGMLNHRILIPTRKQPMGKQCFPFFNYQRISHFNHVLCVPSVGGIAQILLQASHYKLVVLRPIFFRQMALQSQEISPIMALMQIFGSRGRCWTSPIQD